MKKIQIQQLSINEKKNDFVASRLFRSNLYGDSPYGHVMSEESINRVSRKDLVRHFTQWVEGKFDVFLTGKFDSAFQQRVVRFFENKLRETHEFEGKEFQSISHFENRIEKEESLQSSILMGKRCINRDHEKYAGLLLLNEVFGGYFGSRLMQNIREDKGYTYSIYSHMVTMRNDAYFVINTDVKKANKNQAVEEIHSEIDTLKTELIGEEELFQVKNYLKGSMLNTLTTPFALTEKIKNIYFYDLGTDFYEKVFDKIDNTSSQELMELANSVLFNQPLSSVIVG
jgi:predicted Zn-dependent peptidase